MKSNIFSLAIVIVLSTNCFSQTKDFHFRRKIAPADSDGWYSMTLPNNIFKDLNKDFSDIRIYQFSEGDTVESPFLLRVHQQEIAEETFNPLVFNKVKKEGSQFFTFQLPKDTQLNFIDLAFNETNFDGFANLDGSNDQEEWFEIERKQRFISIENQNINFTSTAIHFSAQRFRYLRINLKVDKSLTLKEAILKRETIKPGTLTEAQLTWQKDVDRKLKQTTITITLKNYQPVVSLVVAPSEQVDYYRPFRLEKVSDSTSAPKGWQFFYETITQGYLTSLDTNRFIFDYSLAKKLRLVIDDGDNTPLSINSISMFSPKVELMARMKNGEHYLYYGNKFSMLPSYDLVNFANKIPSNAASLNMGDEEKLTAEEPAVSPLIKNKIWLWVLMGVVIGVLAFFTVRMMNEKK
jgi:hypothetical protein